MTYQSSYNHINEIEDTIERVLIHSSRSRSKNLVVRFDITYPEKFIYPNDNTIFSNFLNSFIKHCTRKKYSPYSVWVREQSLHSLVDNHHFHIVLFLDGNVIQNPSQIHNKATELWSKAIGHSAQGLVHLCRHNVDDQYLKTAIKMRRVNSDFEKTLAQTRQWLRYLSKEYSKEGYPYKGRSFGASQIRN
ncbi:inovirus-type Gp2 protein [Desulfovibrio sp. UCD-KL4C]|uniref:YagK/YfjJ domain-containing protein n=1 Tax=Desulfovibrio sp. UCD-KL4C TaxID=2578120 RepID=UPI0025C27441|nr:inovirus-type Gp2 protein [Desulfovibrio sp. UCD-KL4C]